MSDVVGEQGETLTVDYSVTNTGDTDGTKDIELLIDSVVEATNSQQTINSGQTFSDSFDYVTSEAIAIDVPIQIQTPDETTDSQTFVLVPDILTYLHDDFGDNSLGGDFGARNNAAPVLYTFNGENAVFRPNWFLDSAKSAPSAANQAVEVAQGEGMYRSINLDFSQLLDWRINGIDMSATAFSAGVVLYASINTLINDGKAFENSYFIDIDTDTGTVALIRQDSTGNATTLISGSASGTGVDVRVTRFAGIDTTWELYIDGTSQGTATDDTYSTDAQTGINGSDSETGTITISEYKVL